MTDDNNYPFPVSELLSHGTPQHIPGSWEWFNYVETYGLSEIDVLPLISLAQAHNIDLKDRSQAHAPLHACRALGQLRAPAAINALVALLNWHQYDALLESIPVALRMIGPSSLPALIAYFQDDQRYHWSRIAAAEGITEIAQQYPEYRVQCVQVLTRALAQHRQQTPELNGSLIANLVALQARESAREISQAFQSGNVEEGLCDDWDSVRLALGLVTELSNALT